MRRQRLSLDNLESSGRFFLHRQLLAASTRRHQDPIQLVFPDRTTTIGFVSPNLASIVEGDSRENSTEGRVSQTGFINDSVVVYASASGSDITVEAAREWRRMLLPMLTSQSCIVLFELFRMAQVDKLYISILLVNFWLLLSIHLQSPGMLVLASSFEIGIALLLLYSNPCFGEIVGVSCKFLILFFSAAIMYALNGLKDVYLPQTFLIKQPVSD